MYIRMRARGIFSDSEVQQFKLDVAREELKLLRENWNYVAAGVGLFIALSLLCKTDMAAALGAGFVCACIVKALEPQTIDLMERSVASNLQVTHFRM